MAGKSNHLTYTKYDYSTNLIAYVGGTAGTNTGGATGDIFLDR